MVSTSCWFVPFCCSEASGRSRRVTLRGCRLVGPCSVIRTAVVLPGTASSGATTEKPLENKNN